MNKLVFRCLRIAIVILFLVSTSFILTCQFSSKDLNLRVETNEQVYDFKFLAEEINSSESLELCFENKESVTIEKIRFYGIIKSISLKNLEYGNFAACVASVPNGEVIWKEDGLQFTGVNDVQIILNESGKSMLKSLSDSFLLEKLCLIEGVLIICMLLFVICTAIQEKMDTTIRNNHGPIYEMKRFFNDIKKYWRYMIYAAHTDLKAEVANSYLNRLWWLLEPLFNMLVYVIVFGRVMGRSIENYATFIFSALLMWNFFSKTINYSVKLVRNNKDIVTKVYVPKFVLLLSNMFLNLFKLLFSMIVLVIMLFVFKVHIGFEILWVLPTYIVLILLSFGVGMIFLHYGVYVDDLSYAVGILLNMVMFLSGIFYDTMATLTEPLNVIGLCINPVAMVIDAMRNALLYQEIVNVPLIALWFLISVILCCIGVHIVYKNENGYVKVV